jgi:hypothetical protein
MPSKTKSPSFAVAISSNTLASSSGNISQYFSLLKNNQINTQRKKMERLTSPTRLFLSPPLAALASSPRRSRHRSRIYLFPRGKKRKGEKPWSFLVGVVLFDLFNKFFFTKEKKEAFSSLLKMR